MSAETYKILEKIEPWDGKDKKPKRYDDDLGDLDDEELLIDDGPEVERARKEEL